METEVESSSRGGASKLQPSMVEPKTCILWFRNDLRLHDNAALVLANRAGARLIPIYCFDTQDYGRTAHGVDRTGPGRAAFLLQCLALLRESLRARGSDLVVRIGPPEEVLPDLARCTHAHAVYAHSEVSSSEMQEERRVSNALANCGVSLNYLWGETLLHPDDLPGRIAAMPATFSTFRSMSETVEVRPTLPSPELLNPLPECGIEAGDMPSFQELGLLCNSPTEQPEIGDFREMSGKVEAHPTLASSDLLNPLPECGLDARDMPSCQEPGLQQEEQPEQPEEGEHDANHHINEAPFIGGEDEALVILRDFHFDETQHVSSEVGESDFGASDHNTSICAAFSPWLAIGCLSPRRIYEELRDKSQGARFTESSSGKHIMFELLWRDFLRFITFKYALESMSSCKELQTQADMNMHNL